MYLRHTIKLSPPCWDYRQGNSKEITMKTIARKIKKEALVAYNDIRFWRIFALIYFLSNVLEGSIKILIK